MKALSLVKRNIILNKELINNSAIKNCHAIGLNSFIINENPKIRLFIAESHCELFKPFNPENPNIAIHSHKYHDFFSQIEGELIHHLYEVPFRNKPSNPHTVELNKYKYVRLCDSRPKLFRIGKCTLDYIGEFSNLPELHSKQLHTAELRGDENKRCSWIITEKEEDEDFEQVAYHQNLLKRPELYQKMNNGVEYLKKYFSIKKPF